MYTCIIIRWAANTTEAPKLRENNDIAKGVDGLIITQQSKFYLTLHTSMYERELMAFKFTINFA